MKLKPILLKTNIRPICGDLTISPRYKKLGIFGNFENSYQNECFQYHIYLINLEEEIKKNNWVYSIKGTPNIQRIKDDVSQDRRDYGWNKIIVSTDSSLSLPQLSEQSIKLLIDYYNKNNKMPEFVEIEEDIYQNNCKAYYKKHCKAPNCDCPKHGLSLNSQGTVDISISELKAVFIKHTRIDGDKMIIYGAGKFQEESLIIDQDQAKFLLIDLFKFIKFEESIPEERKYTREELIKILDRVINDTIIATRTYLRNPNLAYIGIDGKKWIEQNLK